MNPVQTSMLQLTRTNLIVTDSIQLANQKEEFARNHSVVLPHFLGADILQYLEQRLAIAHFDVRSDYSKSGREFAREHAVKGQDISVHFLVMLLNNTQLFQALQALTGCPAISNFQGRIYRMEANSGHYDSWHGDNDNGRLLGISINLGRGRYTGGMFQLREIGSQRLCCEIAHAEPGNAHLFRIDPELEHRVTAIEGTMTRLVAAGWFQAGPTLPELLSNDSDIACNGN